jgi:hypothetical protein
VKLEADGTVRITLLSWNVAGRTAFEPEASRVGEPEPA